MDDGILFSAGQSKGDQYHGILQLARVTGKSMEEMFNEKNTDYRLHFQQLKVMDQVIRDYKKMTDKVDFVDMIEQFVMQGNCPLLDVLIVDEAQDLVPLQWRMVHEVMKPCQAHLLCRRRRSVHLFVDGCERQRLPDRIRRQGRARQILPSALAGAWAGGQCGVATSRSAAKSLVSGRRRWLPSYGIMISSMWTYELANG